MSRRAYRGRFGYTECDDSSREASRAFHDPTIVGVAHEDMVGRGTLENFGFGVCDRIRRSEEADVGVAHICPYAQLWLGNGDKRADFARMIHAQFHHRDVRLLSKLQQRQRQADVIVQVPLVLHHAEPR